MKYHVVDRRHGIDWLCRVHVSLHCLLDNAVCRPERRFLGHVSDGVLHASLTNLVSVRPMAVFVVTSTVIIARLHDGRSAATTRPPVHTQPVRSPGSPDKKTPKPNKIIIIIIIIIIIYLFFLNYYYWHLYGANSKNAAKAPSQLLQSAASVMKNVFSRLRNTDSDMSSRSAAGRLFHTAEPLTAKLRSP